jgi:hypothetical protein
MAQRKAPKLQQTTTLTPTKDTLTALKSDVTLETAILELCDNALDAWLRYSARTDPAKIEIITEESDGSTTLIIRDDAGGVKQNDASMLFGLGRTAKNESRGAIGTFGVGAKKSLVNLGLPFTLRSQYAEADTGWRYRITKEWLKNDQDWSVEIYEETNLEPGTTEIRIEDLNYDWDSDTATYLREKLGESYNIFLSDDFQSMREEEYGLTINVDGEIVEAAGLPDWSYTPFDGLFPRRYENIQIEVPDAEIPATLHVTVGLLRKKDSKAAGVDIYCQNRKVESGLRNDVGGFGTDADQIGQFNSHHERLKVLVELETDENGRHLPWDTQKSSIDRYNALMRGSNDARGVYNWLRRIVTPYYEADADTIPRAFLEFYPADNEYATNNGKVKQHDFSERERIVPNCKPELDLQEITEVRNNSQGHAILGIKCPNAVENWQIPAYLSQLKTESDLPEDDLALIESIPESLAPPSAQRLAGQINELARVHLSHGLNAAPALEPWQRSTYERYIEDYANDGSDIVESVPEDLPGSPDEIESNGDGSSTEAVRISMRHLSEEEDTRERAEVFIVLGGDTEEERGAPILDTTREQLCKDLDLPKDATDDILWEEARQQIESLL